MSTTSSLAYLIAGTWLFRRRHRASDPAGSSAFALALGANALGGIAFHGPGGRVPRWTHDAALCATLGAMANLSHASRPARGHGMGVAGLAAAAATVVAFAPARTNQVTGGLAVIAAVRQTHAIRRGLRPSLQGTVLAGVAGVAAVVANVVARPDSAIHQPAMRTAGHGLWHVLSAVSLAAWADATFGRAAVPETTRRGRGS